MTVTGSFTEDLASNPAVKVLYSVLTSLTSCRYLCSLEIRLNPDYARYNARTYHLPRDRLLDILVGEQAQDILGRLRGLRMLHCILALENNSDYDAAWWKEQMTCRLRSHLRSTIALDVDIVN